MEAALEAGSQPGARIRSTPASSSRGDDLVCVVGEGVGLEVPVRIDEPHDQAVAADAAVAAGGATPAGTSPSNGTAEHAA